MSRLAKRSKMSKKDMAWEAWSAVQAWHWALAPADLRKRCPRCKPAVRRSLEITGVAEWEMTSGAQVRSLAFRCPGCAETWEIRQVKRDTFSGWTEPFVLHNGEFAGHLSGHNLGVHNAYSD